MISNGTSLGKAYRIKATDKAGLFELKDRDSLEIWVPTACIHETSDLWPFGKTEGKLIVKTWWVKKAEKEGKL